MLLCGSGSIRPAEPQAVMEAPPSAQRSVGGPPDESPEASFAS